MPYIAKEQLIVVKLSYIRNNYKVCTKSSKPVLNVSVRHIFFNRYIGKIH